MLKLRASDMSLSTLSPLFEDEATGRLLPDACTVRVWVHLRQRGPLERQQGSGQTLAAKSGGAGERPGQTAQTFGRKFRFSWGKGLPDLTLRSR